jgi:lysophospholipase L1-like esterase
VRLELEHRKILEGEKVRVIKKFKVPILMALAFWTLVGLAFAQNPYNNVTFPAVALAASSTTAATTLRPPLTGGGSVGSYSAGTICVNATTLTTVTLGVLVNKGSGYVLTALEAQGAPGTFSTTVTATASGSCYELNLQGVQAVQYVTSGTFTGTGVTVVLTASPNGQMSRGGGGGSGAGVSSFNSRTGAVTPQSGDYTCAEVTGCAGGGTTTNALTINNSGTGAASPVTFNGSAAETISYNTIGAVPSIQNANFAFWGDSRTCGTGASSGVCGSTPYTIPATPTTYDYPAQAMRLPPFSGHGTGTNVGFADDTCVQIAQTYTADLHPLSPAVTGNPGYLYINCGTNDESPVTPTATGTSGTSTITVSSATGIEVGNAVTGTGIGTGAVVANTYTGTTTVPLTVANSGAVSGTVTITPSATTIFTAIQNRWNSGKADNWKVVAITNPNHGTTSATRGMNDAYNALIRGAARCTATVTTNCFDYLMDMQTIMNDVWNQTYFYTDQTHFTNTGYGIWAQSAANALISTGAERLSMPVGGRYISPGTGAGNTRLEENCGYALTTGANNLCGGYGAFLGANTASFDVVLGPNSGYTITSGSADIIVGNGLGDNLTTGGNNVLIGGDTSGNYSFAVSLGNSASVGGNSGIAVGHSATAAGNSLAIGGGATASASGAVEIDPVGSGTNATTNSLQFQGFNFLNSAATIASATTIAPTNAAITITGTAAISTITPPTNFTSMCLDILAGGAWTTVAGVSANNIATALTAVSGSSYRVCRIGGLWYFSSTPTASIAASNETVSFSATPTFSLATRSSIITLTGNITSFTLGAGLDGQAKTLCFVQGSGSYSVTPPANVHGFFTIGTTNANYNCQHFTYLASPAIWVADSTGTINQ